MPKANITQAFHFAKGGEVLLFKKGEQDLPADALEHAIKHGYAKAGAVHQTKAEPAPAAPKDKQ
ncbi:hypothetical protein SAMN05216198_1565 [Halopseudomonas litoralis]|uniref:Uncharacterized protein n=1 Tax=Halopseudomonas litoralis TaxID=797277 RepID=A0A1H1QSB4_9GAMM|nr:hypothetical protein [Halopseudomonas litoralis]SDS26368.1 hypothetical protein SAMN05216198_1565 [Halopseudomonas litoralis]